MAAWQMSKSSFMAPIIRPTETRSGGFRTWRKPERGGNRSGAETGGGRKPEREAADILARSRSHTDAACQFPDDLDQTRHEGRRGFLRNIGEAQHQAVARAVS